jgi:hypothetical protein
MRMRFLENADREKFDKLTRYPDIAPVKPMSVPSPPGACVIAIPVSHMRIEDEILHPVR